MATRARRRVRRWPTPSKCWAGRAVSLIRPGNDRSIRVAEKLGERLTGEVEMLGSKALVYAIERADFIAASRAAASADIAR